MNLFFEHVLWMSVGLTLLLLLTLCLLMGVKHALFIRSNRQHCQTFEHRFSQSTDLITAELQARGADCDMAEVACAGFDAYTEYRHYPASAMFYGTLLELMKRPMQLSLRKVLQQQTQGLVWISAAALLSPLIGITGAIWGASAMGLGPQVIVAGLTCIALGLSVSVLAAMVHLWWQTQLRLRAIELEHFVEEFLRVLSQRTMVTR